MSVHGNEPSGSECSMELAYRLATQSDPEIKEWLKNTVVIIDPSLNPDGYDRYTHWYRMVSNKFKTPQAASGAPRALARWPYQPLLLRPEPRLGLGDPGGNTTTANSISILAAPHPCRSARAIHRQPLLLCPSC
ncbi:MAG: M14 family zinc carboxypeptidase [Saprospiraceae bacterium]